MITAATNKHTLPPAIDANFRSLMEKTFTSEPIWLKERRESAFIKLSESGLPNRKNERYKYTDVRKVLDKNFEKDHNVSHPIHNPSFILPDSIRLVFINGWLHKDSTMAAPLPGGVIVGNLATDGILKHSELLKKYMSERTEPLAVLNEALWTDGGFLFIPDGVMIEKPIEIVHICAGNKDVLANPRHLVVVGKNASVTVMEHYLSADGASASVVNSYTQFSVGENSQARYYRIQDNCGTSAILTSVYADLERSAHFDTHIFTSDCLFVRNNLNIELNGKGAEAHLNGLFLTRNEEFVDNHTAVWHNEPDGQSNQLYKGLLDGRSTGVFNGKIYVKKDAQKTNAYQSSKNILLSDDATINTKPELEIYADDVKCSHGSSTGKVDPDALFYLRSRGLGEESARRMLLSAFANDVLQTIRIDSMKEYLTTLIQEKLV